MEPDARDPQPAIRGRGAASNPRNRFEPLFYAPDPDSDEPTDTAFTTELLRDTSQCFGKRMRGEGRYAEQIASMFALACRKAGLVNNYPGLSTAAFRRPVDGQMSLFDG